MYLLKIELYITLDKLNEVSHMDSFLRELNFKEYEKEYFVNYQSLQFNLSYYQENVWLVSIKPIENYIFISDVEKISIHFFKKLGDKMDYHITEGNISFIKQEKFKHLKKQLYKYKYRQPYETVETLVLKDFTKNMNNTITYVKPFQSGWSEYQMFLTPNDEFQVSFLSYYTNQLQ